MFALSSFAVLSQTNEKRLKNGHFRVVGILAWKAAGLDTKT
jgi:hypothetical protein